MEWRDFFPGRLKVYNVMFKAAVSSPLKIGGLGGLVDEIISALSYNFLEKLLLPTNFSHYWFSGNCDVVF